MTTFDYAARILRAQELIRRENLAGLVIGTGPELAYLTGSWASSHERLLALVITADGATCVAPATDAKVLNSMPVPVVVWRDGENPYHLVAGLLDGQTGAVGLGSSLTTDHVLALRAVLDGALVLATDTLAELFRVKDPEEIAQLRTAGRAIDAVHAQVPALLKPGRTEAEVAAELKHLIAAEHDTVDFIIVGSGPNGANPHHSFSDRMLMPGDPVVIDIGGSVGAGYHSDCTRTYVVAGAEPPTDFVAAYEVLENAQRAAVEAVRPGMTAHELDAVARDIIDAAGYGELFSHRLGHGLGLSLHEQPFIVQGNDLVLQEGMCFSIEPGLYLDGEWGMRIEDIVVVTDTAERLNFQPTAL